ncbi:DUF2381 family protein [Archangium gephyra]|uniref:DUF2381 family protein n=1 Tax=Archangium gephyra TaxID=48 RepID=UPI003B826951
MSGVLRPPGIRFSQFPGQQPTAGGLSVSSGTSYRVNESVAVEAWVLNSSTEPWTTVGASLVTAKGEKMEGLKLHQPEAIPPNEIGSVFIEVPAAPGEPRGPVTLNLWEAGPRSISIPSVMFP